MGIFKDYKKKHDLPIWESVPFHSIILLDSVNFDKNELIKHLVADWDLSIHDESDDANTLIFRQKQMVVSVQLVESPFDQEVITHYANTNYFWDQAITVAKNHKAHLVIVVLPIDNGAVEAIILDSKVNASCLALNNAVGISVVGTVYDPEFYRDAAYRIEEGIYPVLTQVYIRVYYNDADQLCGYTYGLDHFGKPEIEVINSESDPVILFNTLRDICTELINLGVTFEDGEIVELDNGRFIQANLSPSPIFSYDTVKIKYKND